MKKIFYGLATALLLTPMATNAQNSVAPDAGVPVKVSYVRLANNANAIITEPVTPDPVKSRVAILVTHPGHTNNFNYFIGRGLSQHGYKVMAVNYYGPETSYYELLAPISLGIKALRAIPGVEKVVLAGHSTGGSEVTFYQDTAENGPAACQRPERIHKCTSKEAEGLAKADAVMLLDGNSGSPESINGLNPAVDSHNPQGYTEAYDLFSPKNGYNPATGEGKYSDAFLKTFFSRIVEKNNKLNAEAQARLALIENGQGQYKRDEPFPWAGRGLWTSEVKPELHYLGFLSQTHAPHKLLKADGTQPVQVIQGIRPTQKRPPDNAHLYPDPEMDTVKGFLTTAIRLNPDYRWTKDNIYGVDWHSTAASSIGSMGGIHVPVLVMAASCAVHIVYLELAYDASPSKDKEYLGVEGANHGFLPCKPEFGDTFKRTFDYVDGWLSKPGRLL
jgi:pimeloyl-ACP methyl ester carboxylesterase